MGNINTPHSVKIFFGLIFNESFDIKKVYKILEEKFKNKIDIYSPVIDFSFTKYYNKEMGENLKRQWVSFATLMPPELLAKIKVETNNIEDSFAAIHAGTSSEASASLSGISEDSSRKSCLSSASQLISSSAGRAVNIDPGYITPANVILASTKDFSHRIYLSKGIYAEVTTIYRKEGFTKLPWTYPDYLCPTATEFILQARKCILAKGNI